MEKIQVISYKQWLNLLKTSILYDRGFYFLKEVAFVTFFFNF